MRLAAAKRNLTQRGVTLPEVLVGVFIFGTLITAVIGMATLGTRTAIVSEQRTVAQAIANERAEQVRLTPYADVGLQGGAPDGIFLATEEIMRNDQPYTVEMEVTVVDDPENGVLTDPLTEANADYKEVFITVIPPVAGRSEQDVRMAVLRAPDTGRCDQDADCESNSCNEGTGFCDPPPLCTSSSECGAGGACCDGQCLDACLPSDCPAGWACSTDGCGCIPDECVTNDECPSGLCIDGTCEEPFCSEDADCGADRCCEEGQCTDCGCATDNDCDGNEVCDPPTRTCVPPCTSNASCDPTEDCDVATGKCNPDPGPPCTNNTDCPTGQECNAVSGQCEGPTCERDYECQPDQVCDDTKKCKPRCEDSAQCPVDEVCNVESGKCEPEPCATNTDCTGNQICGPDGACIPGSCTSDYQCGSNCCNNGQCGACGCTASNQCPSGQICSGGTCQPASCTSNANCGSGQCCNNGQCGACGTGPNPCQNNSQCPGSQICQSGVCTPPPPVGGACPPPIVYQCQPGIGQLVLTFTQIGTMCIPFPALLPCPFPGPNSPPGGGTGIPAPVPSQCNAWCDFNGDCEEDCGMGQNCTSDTDCGSSANCLEGGVNVCHCAQGTCARDADSCPDVPTPECQTNSDCAGVDPNAVCVSDRCQIPAGGGGCVSPNVPNPQRPGWCVPPQPAPGDQVCTTDANCPTGMTCRPRQDNPAVRVCHASGGCSRDNDCPLGMLCRYGVCESDDTQSCQDCPLAVPLNQPPAPLCCATFSDPNCTAPGDACTIAGGPGICVTVSPRNACRHYECRPNPGPTPTLCVEDDPMDTGCTAVGAACGGGTGTCIQVNSGACPTWACDPGGVPPGGP